MDSEQTKQKILALAMTRKFSEAKQQATAYLENNSQGSEILGIMAGICIELEQFEEAKDWAEKALSADPEYIFGYFLLARYENGQKQWSQALKRLEWLLKQYENRIPMEMLAMIYNLQGHIFRILGDAIAAASASWRAIQYSSGLQQKAENFSNYLFNLNYPACLSDEEVFQEHAKFNTLFKECKPYKHDQFSRHTKIRIGYISPDFRRHVVVYFIYRLLQRYSKRDFTVYCYARGIEDGVTVSLKKMVDHWRTVTQLSFEQTAALIYGDEIDILVDFSGHTSHNLLPVLAYKPAPVQISGIGYFNTTGLKTVDYFLSDQYVDPIGQNDDLFTEKLIRLKHSHFCYTPPDTMPNCQEAPYIKNGFITFGSFNNFTKTTDEILKLWLEILRQVPGSKLLLKSRVFETKQTAKTVLKRLYKTGFRENQLILRPETKDYLREYYDVDIALDTFPYPGGGTTCEALYMGIPVITLAGKRHGSRFGYSLLKNVGLTECIAESAQEYVEKAIALAKLPERISHYHRGALREMMKKSPVMQAKLYVTEVEETYKKIWHTYEEKQKPFIIEHLQNETIKLLQEKDFRQAREKIDQLIKITPANLWALQQSSFVCLKTKQYEKAIERIQQIISQDEWNLEAYLLLSEIYHEQKKYLDELETLELIAALLPHLDREKRSAYESEISHRLGLSYHLFGKNDKALPYLHRAVQVERAIEKKRVFYSKYVLVANVAATISREELISIQRIYQSFFVNVEQYVHDLPKSITKLHIGYLSSHFCKCPEYSFLQSILTDYDKTRFFITCYHGGMIDDVTEQVEKLVDQWRNVHALTAEQIAEQIHQDQVDILVDLDGHVSANLLPVLAFKPAPVQITGIGNEHTTGLKEIDYILTSPDCISAEDAVDFYVESPLSLPQTHLCYMPNQDDLPIEKSSLRKHENIIYGCAVDLRYTTKNMMCLWKQIIKQVKNSKLLIVGKVFSDPTAREKICDELVCLGINRNQIELTVSLVNNREGRDCKADLLLASDTYVDTAVLCQAFSLGIPVLVLKTNSVFSQIACKLCMNTGQAELIAETPETYISKAVQLAIQPDQLFKLQKILPIQLSDSQLQNTYQYVKNLEQAYQRIWKKHQEMVTEALLDKVCEFCRAGEIEEALQVLMNAYESARENVRVVYALTDLLSQIGERETAMKIYRKYKGNVRV